MITCHGTIEGKLMNLIEQVFSIHRMIYHLTRYTHHLLVVLVKKKMKKSVNTKKILIKFLKDLAHNNKFI